MKQDRFLLGILIGIAVLVLLSLVVFFARPSGLEYGEESTPEGVVRNFIVAIHKEDYEKAYAYLAEDEHKPTFEAFSQPLMLAYIDPASNGVEVLTSQTSADRATVKMSIYYNSSDPFSGGYSNTDQASLLRQDGQWKIRQMPYPFWYYDWYEEPYEQPKP